MEAVFRVGGDAVLAVYGRAAPRAARRGQELGAEHSPAGEAALDQDVAANLTDLGDYVASDLLTSWSVENEPPRFLALDALPQTAKNMHVSLVLYPSPSAGGSVRVRLTVTAAGATDPLTEQDLIPTSEGDALRILAALPVEALPPGDYTIRATILDGAITLGTLSRSVHKGA